MKILTTIIALALMCGCESFTAQANRIATDEHRQTAAISSAVDEAVDHVDASDAATQTIPPVPTTQQVAAAITVAHVENKAAKKSLAKIAPAIAATDSDADKGAAVTARADEKLSTIESSWQYRIGGWIKAAVLILAALFGIHIVAGVVALVAPPPYNAIASIIAKFVNPLGWITAMLAHVELKKVTAVAVEANARADQATSAVAEVVNDIKPTPAAHVQPFVPYTPATQAVVQDAVGIQAAAAFVAPQ